MTHYDEFLIALAVTLFVGVNDCLATARAQEWSEQEVLLARLAINEATGRVADTIAITQARAHASVEDLRRMHPRALAPVRTDARRWIADLDGDAHRPEHWPEARYPWERWRPLWIRTLTTVRATLRGEMGCPGGKADVWGGRMDRDRIDRLVARGAVIVDCRDSANVFLRFGGGR